MAAGMETNVQQADWWRRLLALVVDSAVLWLPTYALTRSMDRPARLAVAAHVANDGPNLWGWVIFPRGFRAPAMMELAKRQAWTLKPAVLHGPDPASGGR